MSASMNSNALSYEELVSNAKEAVNEAITIRDKAEEVFLKDDNKVNEAKEIVEQCEKKS